MFRSGCCAALLLVCISACSPTAPLELEPTQTLVVPTLTETPIPTTPTITVTPLPRASDLATATPVVEDSVPTAVDAALEDPVAAALVGLAERRVAELANLPVRRIQLVEVKVYRWPDVSLGCPDPNESYTQQQVDGYRIVVSANGQEYIFHTDFDRVVACAPEHEKLPDAP